MVTASLITQAYTYSTVNAINGSGMWFQLQSSSYTLNNFKYVYVLNEVTNSGTFVQSLGSYYEPPRPYNPYSGLTGTGLFNPYKALRSQINNAPDWNITLQGLTPVTQSIVPYQLQTGFSYNPGWTFSTSSHTYLFTLYLQLNFSSPVDLQINDLVTINMTTLLYNPQYNGTWKVFLITGGSANAATAVVLRVIYGTVPSTTELGEITNIQRISGTTSTFWGWNGDRQYQESNQDFYNPYVVTGTSSSFLTNYYNPYIPQPTFGNKITPPYTMKPVNADQWETIGFLYDPTSTITAYALILYDSNGYVISSGVLGLTSSFTTSRKYELGIGPKNIDLSFVGINWNTVAYYNILLYYGTAVSGPKASIWRRINTDCNYCYYTPIQVTWLNRRGSYEYYTFNKDSQRTVQVTKKEWMNNLLWNFKQGDRINSVLSQDIEIDYTINSDWVSQYDQNWMEELATSPEVYIIDGTNRIPIYITDSSWTSKTLVRDQLFNMTVNYKYAFTLVSQDN